jgi:hypothetical protein
VTLHVRSVARWTVIAMLLLGVLAGCGRGDQPAPTLPTTSQPAAGQQLQPLTSGRDVTAPDARYSLRVPLDWVEAGAPVAEVSYRSTDPASPLQLSIVREQLATIRQPQAYAEAGRRQVSEVYRNVITLSLSPVRIGNREAWRWTYTAESGGQERYFYQLYIVDGSVGLVLTGLAPIQYDFNQAQATFDSIAATITFARG